MSAGGGGAVEPSDRPIRVLIVDDHAMVAEALAALLALRPELLVVGQATRSAEAPAQAVRTAADVVLLDVVMPDGDGFDVLAALRTARPEAAVLMVTAFAKPGYARRALAAGARGFLAKGASGDELTAAIQAVWAGRTVVAPDLLLPDCPLTAQELTVLRAAARSGDSRAIARRVYLSPGTVRNHLSRAMAKLGAVSRADAVRLADEAGWL
ncbi:MAG: response regulator transcription factor [Propionibacteriaceae bacterium]|jgi:two-component system response regulator DesR|nr:response regulator transcription factor [Propionibacteriaceae bacterium]